MNYQIIVINDNEVVEKIIFSYRDEALYFAEKRRKSGYKVIVKPIEIK